MEHGNIGRAEDGNTDRAGNGNTDRAEDGSNDRAVEGSNDRGADASNDLAGSVHFEEKEHCNTHLAWNDQNDEDPDDGGVASRLVPDTARDIEREGTGNVHEPSAGAVTVAMADADGLEAAPKRWCWRETGKFAKENSNGGRNAAQGVDTQPSYHLTWVHAR
jgi:hypothetical protein